MDSNFQKWICSVVNHEMNHRCAMTCPMGTPQLCLFGIDKLKAGGVGGLPKLKCLGTFSFPPYSFNSFPAQSHIEHPGDKDACKWKMLSVHKSKCAANLCRWLFQINDLLRDSPLFAQWKRRVSPACGIHIPDMSVMSVSCLWFLSTCFSVYSDVATIRED